MNAEITEEVSLVATRGFEAASGHKKKDNRTMEFVAATKVDSRLVLRRVESSLIVELDIALEFGSEIVAHHEATQPAVRPFVDELVADFVIHIHGPKFLRKLERQKERIARRSDSTPNGIVGIIDEELREHRHGQPRLPGIVKAPLHARIGLTQTKLGPGRRILNPEPGIFVGELDAFADAKIDVEIGSVGDGLIAVEKRHVAHIDFPVEMAWSSRIIGVVRGAALAECRKETEKNK